MSILPEILIQRAIYNGLGAIRKDPRIVNTLFKNYPITMQEDFKKYLLETKIDLSINYPLDGIKVPGIVILLKSENESEEFLGDVMGTPPNYDMPDQDMEVDILGGSATSTTDMGGLPALILGALNVQAMLPGKQAITFTEASQDLINEVFSQKSNWGAMNLHVVNGDGKGKVYSIRSITSSQLDIEGTFELDLSSTSVVDIREISAPEAAYGNPVRSYEQSLGQVRIGANYATQYQLEIFAGNQEQVICLYTVLKAILFAQRKFLEAQGVMALKISGSDFAPRSELAPSNCFTRSMTLQFTYPFEFIVEQEVAKAISIVLTNVNPLNGTPYPGSEIIVARIEL